ncbi:MAG: hypothetical protein FJ267_11835, partial [Planctomycetes bacterium]|nr:hypothetical protein [Planctomycetota bacterium]
MKWPEALLIIYCILIAISSFLGGCLPSLIKLTHFRMQFLVSLIGGLMLGVGVFHQFPHAISSLPTHQPSFAINWCSGWLMTGLLTTFFMLRIFHFHNHEPVVSDDDEGHLCGHQHDHDHDAGQNCLSLTDHKHDHAHEHGHTHDRTNSNHVHTHHPTQGASWIGIFLGLSIHT